MDISVRWFDVTNTVSIFVNGYPLVESAGITTDLRSSYTVESWDDSFLLDSLSFATTSTASFDFCNVVKTNYNYSIDLDDITIYDISTSEGLPYYYSNSFEGAHNSLVNGRTVSDSAVNSDPAHILARGNDDIKSGAESNGNSYVTIDKGDYFGIKDQAYQMLSASSWVSEIKIKDFKYTGTVTDKKTPLFTYEDGGLDQAIQLLFADKDGNVYLTSDAKTVIPGVNVGKDTWTHIAVVCENDMTNRGVFGSFNSAYKIQHRK